MDDFFNHEVADWITKSMSRMDPDEAEMFAQFFVYEVHKQDIENNRRTIDSHVAEVSKSLMDDLQPALREEISKAFDAETPYELKFGKPQPRAHGKWSKIGVKGPSISYERSKGKFPQIGVTGEEGPNAQGRIDVTGALNQTGKATSSFAERWTEQGENDYRTNERTYRRVAAGAELLGRIPGAGPHAQLASQVGQFAGQFGPEAEKVIGPTARRTAYRYRGTEREPDKKLDVFHEQARDTLRKRTYSDRELKAIGGAPSLTAEQNMAAAEDAAVGYLVKRLPKKNLATLHRESGKIPPSEGVIINADGDIVTQAVGYQEDHYIPFNLKNLKGLKGGSYVRTRSSGGLTSEDIYTGLVAGARSVTVVSRSGVFTLDFDDHLRGGRRYSDKARQMVGRYAQTLDAVQSQKVPRRNLTPDERAEIRDEIERENEGLDYPPAEIEGMIRAREQEYSRSPHLTKAEMTEVNARAKDAADSYGGPRSQGTERMPADPDARFRAYKSQFMDQLMEQKQKRMYQLDAEGYEAAMQALEEQFPYFVDSTRVRKIPGGETEKDSGYVRPRYNRPEAAKEGYFDEAINGKGKFSASEMHYQNYRHQPKAEGAAATAEGAEGAQPAAAPKKINLAEARVKGQAMALHKAAVKQGAEAASNIIGNEATSRATLPMVAKFQDKDGDLSTFSDAEIQTLVKNLNTLEAKVKKATNVSADDVAVLQRAIKNIDDADRQMKSTVQFDVKEFDPAIVSKYPQKWGDQPQYVHENKPEVYVKAYDTTVNSHKLGDLVPANPTDASLMAVQEKLANVHSSAKAFADNLEDGDAQLRFVNAAQDYGYGDDVIRKVQNAAVAGDNTQVSQIANQAGVKATAVYQLRSIVNAAGGKLDRSAPAAATEAVGSAAEPLKGELVTASTKPPVIDRIEKLSKDPAYIQRHRTLLNELASAVEEGDEEGAGDVLAVLPSFLQKELTDPVMALFRKDND
jgi:hypothetical protein